METDSTKKTCEKLSNLRIKNLGAYVYAINKLSIEPEIKISVIKISKLETIKSFFGVFNRRCARRI